MALPKKQVKYTHDITPPNVDPSILNYGMSHIEELMLKTNTKTKYLPRTILFSDLDNAVFKFVESEHGLELVVDGKKVPVFFLTKERWGEFEKTWKFMDDDKNVPTPYITVRRTGKGTGTRLDGKHRVAQGRKFRYMDVPILDSGEIIYLRFKMPEPVNVDLTYEITLFTKYMVDVNLFDEIIFKAFASKQAYTYSSGTPLPVLLESTDESGTMENIDGDRFYAPKYSIKLLGLLQDEKEFEIVKTTRQPRIGYAIK
jgi:hypothetical protein